MIEELWSGGPRINNRSDAFRLGADSILLASFAIRNQRKRNKHAVDLGCGSGIISILLAWHDPELNIQGIEIQNQAAKLAVENINLNGLSERIAVLNEDLRCCKDYLKAGIFDLSISNPPYNVKGRGRRSQDNAVAAARNEELCTINDVCAAAGYLTRWGGSFFLVQRPERLNDVFRAFSSYGFEPKRLRFVHHNLYTPPGMVLIEGRRGGKPSLITEAPLILKDPDGSDSEEIKKIYHMN